MKGIFLYGAGELGRLAVEFCEACKVPVCGILDRNRSGSFVSKRGRAYQILAPQAKAQDVKKTPLAVAIASLPYLPIRRQLQRYGWKHVFPFYRLTSLRLKGHPLRNGWMLGNVTAKEYSLVSWICDQWVDDHSNKHFEGFVAWHRDNTELNMGDYPIRPEQRYMIPPLLSVLKYRKQQFVDVGSHHAETIKNLRRIKIIFKEYTLFEPDKQSYNYLKKNYKSLFPRLSNIKINNVVLGQQETTAGFIDELGYCSQIWEKSKRLRRIFPLDLFKLSPDFLKIHTEGSELEILKGARETISRSKPCIAFPVYHRRAGISRDIAGAMMMLPNYKWYFRLHSYQGTGAFVYAIPRI